MSKNKTNEAQILLKRRVTRALLYLGVPTMLGRLYIIMLRMSVTVASLIVAGVGVALTTAPIHTKPRPKTLHYKPARYVAAL